MKIPKMFLQKKTALDGKIWWCVCYKGIRDEVIVWTKKKTKKEAQSVIDFYSMYY